MKVHAYIIVSALPTTRVCAQVTKLLQQIMSHLFQRGLTVLMAASQNGHTNAVEALLKNSRDVNATDEVSLQ